MIKVVHISTSLETGGAEVQLLRLLTDLDKSKFEMIVISLHNETYLTERVRALGIPVYSLELKKHPLNIRKAYSILKEFNPDVIHGTMYEGVVGTLFNKFLSKNRRLFGQCMSRLSITIKNLFVNGCNFALGVYYLNCLPA